MPSAARPGFLRHFSRARPPQDSELADMGTVLALERALERAPANEPVLARAATPAAPASAPARSPWRLWRALKRRA